MVFAKFNGASFEDSKLGIKLTQGQIFMVTPEFEKTDEFQRGLKTGNFKFYDVKSRTDLEAVIGITDEEKAKYLEKILKTSQIVPPKRQPVISTPITIPEKVYEEELATQPVPEVETLSFTEEAGSVKNALVAIAKETDKTKLNFALENDDRKSVKAAIDKRLKELK